MRHVWSGGSNDRPITFADVMLVWLIAIVLIGLFLEFF